jgi:aminoglycoside phosphotransferase (APT) family kinase protein
MEQRESNLPSPRDAAEIAGRVLGERVARVERFTTGLANFVYDVTGESGAAIVIRIATPRGDTSIPAAVYWSSLLRPMGVPLPRLIAHHVDENGGFSWMALERLPGTDLWHVYHTLSPQQRRDIVKRIVEMQRIVQSLPAGGGFGYVDFPRDWPHRTFGEMFRTGIEVARRGIEQVGVVDVRHVARIERLLPAFEDYIATVRPTPFLHDTTTKNVIIDDDGRVSGIVDVDSLCYGDPVGVIGLTRMALLNLGHGTDYTDCWLDRIDATPLQRRAVTLYASLCCLHFMSELGQRYNLDAAPPVDARDVERLESILDQLLAFAE